MYNDVVLAPNGNRYNIQLAEQEHRQQQRQQIQHSNMQRADTMAGVWRAKGMCATYIAGG